LFGIRIRDAAPSYNGYSAPNQPPRYNPYQSGNVLDGINNLKAGALRTGSNALRFKVNKIFFNSTSSNLQSELGTDVLDTHNPDCLISISKVGTFAFYA